MERLILFVVVTLPFYTLGGYVGGSFISFSHIAALMLAFVAVLKVSSANFVLPAVTCRWMKWFLLFLLAGVIGLLISPFGMAAWVKGGVQIVGMVIMLFMGLAIMQKIVIAPSFIVTIARSVSLSVTLFALVGCLQFLIWNFSPFHSLLRFDILNDIAGGHVWGNPGMAGPVYRVNSVAAEPTHYVRFLGLAIGWALIRLGVAGSKLKAGLSQVMPLWMAVVILFGFMFSFSLNGIFMLICCVLVMVVVRQGADTKKIIQFFSASVLLAIFFSALALLSGGALIEKLGTASLLYNELDYGTALDDSNLSALAIASNIDVSVSNLTQNLLFGGGLGSHPLAYEIYAPQYVYENPILERLNVDDAASLFFRLLSETGLLGLLFFVGGVVVLLKKARRAIMGSMLSDNADVVTRVAISVGLVSSAGGVFALYLLRTGHYIDPVLWVLFSLVAAIPVVLKKSNYKLEVAT